MKVCLFVENHYKGGLDTFLINLIDAWPNAEDELTLMCNASHPGLATIESKVRRPVRIRRYRYLWIGLGRRPGSLSRLFVVRALIELGYRILEYPVLFPGYVISSTLMFRASDYDRLIVVNGGYPASLVSRSASIAWRLAGKRPLAIHNFHNFSTREPWFRRLLDDVIDRWVRSSTSWFVSVSEACLESLRLRDVFRSSANLKRIANGIEDPEESTQAEGAVDAEKPAARYVLMLATYEARKGHAYLLDAFAIVSKACPDVELRMYGHGREHERNAILSKIESLGLTANVSLNEFVPSPDRLIRDASVLVMPSQSFESFGLTLIESMARRTPVVATRVGGMSEVVDDGTTGLLADPRDPADFARALIAILTSPSLAESLAAEGRKKFVRCYRAPSMAEAYWQLLSVESEGT